MRVYQLIRVSGGRPTATSGHRTAHRKRWDDLERIMRMVSSAIPIITFRYYPYKRKKLTFWVSLKKKNCPLIKSDEIGSFRTCLCISLYVKYLLGYLKRIDFSRFPKNSLFISPRKNSEKYSPKPPPCLSPRRFPRDDTAPREGPERLGPAAT